MKHLSISVLLCLFNSLAFTQGSSDVHFNLQVPFDTIGLNEQLQLRFTLNNAEIEHIVLPTIPGFEQLQQPSRSQSVSIINGRRSSKTVYTYALRPTTTGTFYLPPVPVETSAGLFETMEMPITVVEYRAPRQTPSLSQSPFGGFDFPQGGNGFSGGSLNFDDFFHNNFPNFPEMPDLHKSMEEIWKELQRQPKINPQDKKKKYRL